MSQRRTGSVLLQSVGATRQAPYLETGPPGQVQPSSGSRTQSSLPGSSGTAHSCRATGLLLTVTWAKGWESSNDGFGSSSVHNSLNDDLGPVTPLSGLQSPHWTRPVVTQGWACFTEYQCSTETNSVAKQFGETLNEWGHPAAGL